MIKSVDIREKTLEDGYRKVRKRVEAWVSSKRLLRRSGFWTDHFLQYLLVLPDLAHLTVRLLLDSRVDPAIKGRLLMGMSYLILPLDFIPDFIPCVGLIDDLLVLSVILNRTINQGSPELKAMIQEHWAGSKDVFDQVRRIIAVMNEVAAQIPRSLLAYIRGK